MCLNLFRLQSECAAAEIERGRGDKETRGEPRMECPGKVKKGGGRLGETPKSNYLNISSPAAPDPDHDAPGGGGGGQEGLLPAR